VHGNLEGRDAHIVYRQDGRVRAVVTLGRDKLALEVEKAMEQGAHAELDKLVRG
jgi:hypothetical protein